MYIWAGCRLPEEFESEIRRHCLELNRDVGLDTVAFDLPQHISLKISFRTDRAEDVTADLEDFFARQQPFSVRLLPPERFGNILWLPVAENDRLRQLHETLDGRLERRFGIPQHELDKCFLFHSTLFMDADADKIARMERLLAEYPLPGELNVDTFLLGASETGKPGECRIVREIKV